MYLIQGIWNRQQEGFTRSLEEKAKSLTGRLEENLWDLEIASVVKREIALTLHHIARLRSLHEKQRQSIRRVELHVRTELHQLEQRIPRYAPYRFAERERFQSILFMLERERRDLAERHEDKLQNLEARLLSLLDRHSVISENGYPNYSTETRTSDARQGREMAESQRSSRSYPASLDR